MGNYCAVMVVLKTGSLPYQMNMAHSVLCGHNGMPKNMSDKSIVVSHFGAVFFFCLFVCFCFLRQGFSV